jgi:hypothetical protein
MGVTVETLRWTDGPVHHQRQCLQFLHRRRYVVHFHAAVEVAASE